SRKGSVARVPEPSHPSEPPALVSEPGRTGQVAASTCTRLSKNVAPPPRSVSRVLVVALTLTASATYFRHHSPSVTTTPGPTVGPTAARAWNAPRSLKTRTLCPSTIPRTRASSGWISSAGAPASRRSESTLTKVEFRNDGCGGLTSCSG